MIKKCILPEEWYPVLVLEDHHGIWTREQVEREFTSEEINQIEAATAQFKACQEMLRKRHEAK